ncbi:glycoside hydrolase family 28 protein [Streptomyces brasiliensis]|uniref:Glycoside hydrolase n=1 Tax=Streptomyces brasiliensis TaxID=1954 RepID=A0A917LDW8_9ACTN|nr:glycoside hydrolase family 28 protein [Streptomyces brasiliensis]GGJ59318.1 glycoside hydrolase [Streptomyces brasiliensis]
MTHSSPNRRQLLRSAIALGSAAVVPSLLPSSAFAQSQQDADRAADVAADRIIAAIHRPRIPQREIRITDFGAVPDGTTDTTQALANAIQSAHRRGGGRVVVPSGTWATGPIHLLSRVELHLVEGATLLFHTDPAAYLPTVYSRWQGIELMNYSPLIYAYGQHDIALTGNGVLDGQASTDNWYTWGKPGGSDFSALEATANAGIPVPERDGANYHLRPCFVEPYRCERVLVEGVTLRNSPFWNLHPTLCQDVTIRNVTVESTGPNTDGCDPESCDGVLIEGVSFNTGDDCIAVKAGRNTDGRRVNVPCQNLVVQNSTFANGHGGITLGSEMTGGIRNVYGRDLTMSSTGLRAGHRLKTNSVRGGFLENSHVYRVNVQAIGGPLLLIDFNYGEGDTGTYPPTVTDINLSHWSVASASQGWDIQGYADDPVGTVRLSDVTIDGPLSKANTAVNVTDLELDHVVINGVEQ